MSGYGRHGRAAAIQCKFYDPGHTLQKAEMDSFFTASGRTTSRMIISTSDQWRSPAEAALNHQQIPVARLRMQDLADSPVAWTQFSVSRQEHPTESAAGHVKDAAKRYREAAIHPTRIGRPAEG
jgi:predicted helicase